MTMANDPGYNTWDYRDTAFTQDRDLVGYDVEATDGSIGKIDETSNEAGASHVVVDTGPWIFGTKRLIPAGAISSVDHDARVAHIGMTKDEIKSAPTTTATPGTTTPAAVTTTTTAATPPRTGAPSPDRLSATASRGP